MTTDIMDYNVEDYTWGHPCRKHNHHNAEGYALRHNGRGCVACILDYPPGLADLDIPGITKKVRLGCSPEEKRLKQIEHSLNWTRKNKQKHREYVKKYNAKPERVELNRARSREVYMSMSEEERSIKAKKQYEIKKERMANDPEYAQHIRNLANRKHHSRDPEEVKESNKKYYAIKKERMAADPEYAETVRKQARDAYHSRTPEQKEYIRQKKKEYLAKKKEKDES